jgi:FtsZ-interacting cell division protein ZipA
MNQADSLPNAEEQPRTPQAIGHETTDVNPYYLTLFGIGLLVIVAIVLLVLAWMFRRMETAARRADPPPSPVADDQVPPPPRLQTAPAADLAQMRREDQHVLSSYAWTDREQRKVRIPIDRAMEILVQRGFPEPAPPPPAPIQQPDQPQQDQPQQEQQQQQQSARSTEPSSAGGTPEHPTGACGDESGEEPQERRLNQPQRTPQATPRVESGR